MDAPFGDDCEYYASVGKIFAHRAGESISNAESTTHHEPETHQPEIAQNTELTEAPHCDSEGDDDNGAPNHVCDSDCDSDCGISPPPHRPACPDHNYGHFQAGEGSSTCDTDSETLFYQLANTQADSVTEFRKCVSAFAHKLQRLRQGDRYITRNVAHWNSMIGGYHLRYRSQVVSLVSFSLHVEVALSLHKISKRTHRGILQFLRPYKLSVGHTFRLLDGCQLQFEEIFEIKKGLYQSEKGCDRLIRSSIPFIPMNPYRPQSDARLNSILRRLPGSELEL